MCVGGGEEIEQSGWKSISRKSFVMYGFDWIHAFHHLSVVMLFQYSAPGSCNNFVWSFLRGLAQLYVFVGCLCCVEENVESASRRHHSSSSPWRSSPHKAQEAESGERQPEWRRQRPARTDGDEWNQSAWERPRPAHDDDEQETQPEWRRPRPQREEGNPSGGSWAQVLVSPCA